MGKEEDWKELEKWQKEQDYKMENKYGANLTEHKFKKPRKKLVLISKIFDKFAWLISYCVIALWVLIGVGATVLAFICWHSMTKISVPDVIENRYGIYVDNLSPEFEEGEEGKYLLQLEEIPEIQFHAIKKNITISDDYSASCHKYFFEKWQSKAKEHFTVNELTKDGLLQYETIILIKNDTDMMEAENIIREFREYAGKWYSENWKIEIRKL